MEFIVGNVAYGKTANQKDGNGFVTVLGLTDGVISGNGCLQKEDSQGNLVIVVDLQRKHKLESVTLFLSHGNHGNTWGNFFYIF